jgi:RNA polymerase sigma-B factor
MPCVTDDRLLRSRDDDALRRYARTRDPALRDRLVDRWMPLARKLARRYRNSSEPFDDLMQVAAIGLIKAIHGFDPGRGRAFTSYAVPTIMGELKRHFRDRTWAVRMPRQLQERAAKVEAAGVRLGRELGRAPSVGDLAAAVGASEEEVLEAMQAATAYQTTSFDSLRSADGDEFTLGDLLGEDDDGYRLAEDRAMLGALLPELSTRDREILRLRFEEDLTQSEIAAHVGVSQMQVSRLIRRSLGVLRLAADRRGARARPAPVPEAA